MNVTGRSYPRVELTIEADPVEAFARALGADPEAGVPPTFAAVYALAATAPQLFGDDEAAVDYGRLVHGEQEFVWERHPEIGETVFAKATVVEDRELRGMRMLTLETICTDAGGGRICTSRMLTVIRP